MTQTNGKPRSATFEDLRAARFRSAEVLGISPDGEPLTIHWLALSAAKVVEYLDREESDEVSQSQKYMLAIADLAENLVTEDGQPLATKEDLMALPADTINTLMSTVAGAKPKAADEGNASGEAAGVASPTD